MRIGTWNLAGRCSAAHVDFLGDLDCDVMLLTEVRDDVHLPGYEIHLTAGEMAKGRRWAGVYSRIGLRGLPDAHPASAVGRVGDLTFCSTVLPWLSCGVSHPWSSGTLAEKTNEVLDHLVPRLPVGGLVWGGDWNNALQGPHWGGSLHGRRGVLDALDRLHLGTPTAELPHRKPTMRTIDHIAVPLTERVSAAYRVSATVGTRGLSDHDAYVVVLQR